MCKYFPAIFKFNQFFSKIYVKAGLEIIDNAIPAYYITIYRQIVQRSSERRLTPMFKSLTIFENEEADRLFNYFVSYREIVTKEERLPDRQVQASPK